MTAPARSALLALLPRGLAAALAAALLATGLSAPASATPEEEPTPTDEATEVLDGDPAVPTTTEEPTEGAPASSPAELEGTTVGPQSVPGDTAVSDDVSAADETPQSTIMSAAVFARPLPAGSYRMTSPQGPRCAPTINASLAHMGQDMAAPYGTPIYAIAAGTVRWARPEPTAGQWIVIEHMVNGRLVTSAYSHSRNATEFVKAGDKVRAGQRIGTVASTGVSTGNHLHLEIWEGKYGLSGGGKVVNPDSWLADRGVSLRSGATSVYLPRTPTSCTYWALGTMRLYSSPSSSATVVATVLSGTVLTTPGAGVKTNSFIQVTTATGIKAWAPASQVSPNRVSPASHDGVLDRDFTGDGFSDILAADSKNRLLLYVGNGNGKWRTARHVGTWWSSTRLVAANDFNRDGHADVIGVDKAGGVYLYPGRGDGTFGTRTKISSGWSQMVHVFSPGDWNGDAKIDLMVVDASGKLWLYRGNGRGGLLAGRTLVGSSGWSKYTQVTAGGDMNQDGKPDILAVDRDGRLFGHYSNGTGKLVGKSQLSRGWASLPIQPLGLFDADRRDDFLAVAKDGSVLLYRGSPTGWVQPRQQIGKGWTGMRVA